jgi:hypothetical protein
MRNVLMPRRLARSTALTAALALAAPAVLAASPAHAAGRSPAPCGTFSTQAVYPTRQTGLVQWDTNTKALLMPRLRVEGTLSNAANCSAQTNLWVTFQDGSKRTGWGPWTHWTTPTYRTIGLTTGQHDVFPYRPNMRVPITFDYTDWHSSADAITHVSLKVCSAYPSHGQRCAVKSVPGQNSPNSWESFWGVTATSGVWGPWTPRNPPFTVSTSAPVLPHPRRRRRRPTSSQPAPPVLETTPHPSPVAAQPVLRLTNIPRTCRASGGTAGASATATLEGSSSVVWKTVSLTGTSPNTHFRVDLLVPPTWANTGVWRGFSRPTTQPFALNHPTAVAVGSKLYVSASFPDGSHCGLSVVSSLK